MKSLSWEAFIVIYTAIQKRLMNWYCYRFIIYLLFIIIYLLYYNLLIIESMFNFNEIIHFVP